MINRVFRTECLMTLEPIDVAKSYLVKVPAPSGTNEKTMFYYLSDIKDLDRLYACPLTRRKGQYQFVKLSNLTVDQITSLEASDNRLKDGASDLDSITDKFKWETKQFSAGISGAAEHAVIEDVGFQPVHYELLAAYLGAQLGLLVAYYDGTRASLAGTNSMGELAGGMLQLLGRAATGAAVAAATEYTSLRLTNNRFGLFSSSIGAYVDTVFSLTEYAYDTYQTWNIRNNR